MRLDRPIGIYLVLWPTLWALWLAAEGVPHWHELLIFVLGTVVMRSAGCVINDYADRDIDGHVSRTVNRPLANNEVSPQFALYLFGGLLLLALGLVSLTNTTTVVTALGAVALTVVYPFMKRHTYLPQIVLGAAFAWAIPMAFAAVTETLPKAMWTLYIAVLIWTVIYDTFYAMVDREDDLKIGVKSTAILFAENDRLITASLQAFTLIIFLTVGVSFNLQWPFYLSLMTTAGLFGYQQFLIRQRNPARCFEAFLNNNWVGMVLFIGIVLSYAVGG
ncbi:MAG TPA: 4-hydroxybenzoate octaprenyltransferase [Marinagarivorans sp.]